MSFDKVFDLTGGVYSNFCIYSVVSVYETGFPSGKLVPRGVAQGHIIFTARRNDHFCLYIIRKELARKKNEIAFYPHSTSWVYSIAVLLALLGILDIDVPTTDLFFRKYTQHHLITHKTFTSYDMYDYEKERHNSNSSLLGTARKREGARVAWDAARIENKRARGQ